MAGSMGVFLALDLVLFFAFFEIVLVPMYFLIGLWGHGERIYAATKFFLYTMFGSAFMLVGLVSLAVLNQQGVGGQLTFDLVRSHRTRRSRPTNRPMDLLFGFAIAFAVKVPLFPLHTWLPDAHTEAPTAGSVILAGGHAEARHVRLRALRALPVPRGQPLGAPVLLTLGVIGIIYGAIAATMQKDLKRLVAYSSVAHLGFIVLGVFSLTTQGIEGGILIMVNHGIITGALFLLVGWIYERRHTRRSPSCRACRRWRRSSPACSPSVMLASIGVPGLNGFPGEFLALLGAFAGPRWWAVVAVIGVILAALYLLWAYQRVFHGPPTEGNEHFRELRWSEGLVIAPLLALIVFLGIYPTPMLERIEPSVRALVEHIDERVDGVQRDRDRLRRRLRHPRATRVRRHEGRTDARITAAGPADDPRGPLDERHTRDRLVRDRTEPDPDARRRAAADRRVARAGPHPLVVRGGVDHLDRGRRHGRARAAVAAGPGRRRRVGHGRCGRPRRLLVVRHRRHVHLGGLRRAAARGLPATGGPRRRRVVRADAAVRLGRRDDGLGERPDRDVPRLEILSVAVYVLAAMHAKRVSSQEAGLKYFVLGAFSSAFLLYGIALVYGATGSTNLVKIQQFLSETVLTQNGLLLAGFALHARRVRLQGRRRAVPHLDPGRLPGLALAGGRLHGLGCEGRRVRRAGARLRRHLRARPTAPTGAR
jgi:proton-translocating NADH-quinone oxidoreductase chain M